MAFGSNFVASGSKIWAFSSQYTAQTMCDTKLSYCSKNMSPCLSCHLVACESCHKATKTCHHVKAATLQQACCHVKAVTKQPRYATMSKLSPCSKGAAMSKLSQSNQDMPPCQSYHAAKACCHLGSITLQQASMLKLSQREKKYQQKNGPNQVQKVGKHIHIHIHSI